MQLLQSLHSGFHEPRVPVGGRRESAQMAELLLTPGGGAPGLRGVPYYSVPQCGVPYYRALVWPSCATMQ